MATLPNSLIASGSLASSASRNPCRSVTARSGSRGLQIRITYVAERVGPLADLFGSRSSLNRPGTHNSKAGGEHRL